MRVTRAIRVAILLLVTLTWVPGVTAAPPKELGGVWLDFYCQSFGWGDTAVLTRGEDPEPPNAAVHNWACANGEQMTPIRLGDACRWWFGSKDVIARFKDVDDPYSWSCYALTPGAKVSATGLADPAVLEGFWRPFDVAAGDIDADGHLDVAVTDFNSHSIVALYGDGSGGFDRRADYGLDGYPGPTGIVVADFNADGRKDVAFATGAPRANVMLARDDGTLGTLVTTPTSGAGYGILATDLNADGRIDLALTADGGGVEVLLGDGTGAFGTTVRYATGREGYVGGIGAGDIDGNGSVDLVASDFYGALSVLPGNGDGTFGEPTVTLVSGWQVRELAVADVNRDRKADVIVASGCSCLDVFLGTSSLLLTQAASIGTGGQSYAVALANLNRDRYPDLVSAGEGFGASHVGSSSASFGTTGISLDGIAYGVAAGDLNEDGRDDLIVPNTDWGGVVLTSLTTVATK